MTTRTLITLILAIFLCGCGQPSAWLMTGPDLDQETNTVTGRIGIQVDPNSPEFGIEINYLDGIKDSQTYAAYLIQEYQIIDLGKQYIGGRFGMIDAAESGLSYSFILGEAIPIQKNLETVIEGQYIEYDRQIADKENEITGFAGIKARF